MAVGLLQEALVSIGFKKQVDLATPLVAGDMWTLSRTSEDLPQIQPTNEDDATDLGKGVYPTQVFPSHLDARFPLNGRLTSQSGALLSTFGLGATTKTTPGAGAFLYTSVAPDLTAGLDMPVTTVLSGMRQGGSPVVDVALKGCACEEWGIQCRTGPGRDNALFTSQWIGTGGYVKPSTITAPAATAEAGLNSGGITALTFLGFDYLANKRFSTFNFLWKNSVKADGGYHPGSGTQGGYQTRGRMRRGRPAITLSTEVECDSGSSEEDAVLAQTVGTGVITFRGPLITGAVYHQLTITFHRLVAKVAPIGQNDDMAVYRVDYSVQKHATNGVLTVAATTTQDNILTSA